MTQRSPYTAWLLMAVVVATLTALLLIGKRDAWLVGGGLVLLLASSGLVAGMWPAWLFLTLVAAADLLAALVRWPGWWAVLINGTMLILLLARPTRRHAVRWRPLPRG
jgi:hypothetical protein